ncbi:MAG: helix-turn-helix domain-containing protein [Prevotella sp.]|nr:helix-turn-helix domain-containing protein [Prevotella sp.]
MMPVMNGLQFCQLIKDNMATSHVPVILLTARALSKHQVEGYRSGADAYITKPFQPDVLQARIENLLHQRQQLRELWTTDNANDNVNANNAQPSTLNPQHSTLHAQPSTPNAQPSTPNAPQEAGFIQRFRQVVEKHMADSDLSVEDIGSELGLSRVQLYRKVKALTSLTPVEQLRKARLTRARQLLESTDLSISEVAYQVGFTAPSYFTKCFKEEYDMLPGDVRGR